MRTQDFIVAIVAIVAIAFVLIYSVGGVGERSDGMTLVSELPTYERWAVVETTVAENDETTKYRKYMVAPDGTWYIIPAYHSEWANLLSEGREVKLPGSIDVWRAHAPPILKFNPLAGETVRRGGMSATDEPIAATHHGIYFFGRRR